MMNRREVVTVLVCVAAGLLFTWLFGAYATLEPNLTEWTSFGRFLQAWLGITLGIVAAILALSR